MSDNHTAQKTSPLATAPVLKLIAKFAIPSIISMLVSALYNITDQIFIGRVVGMLGNSATSVTFPVVTLTTAFTQLVGTGTAANFNICMGAKEEDRARKFLGTGLISMAAVGLGVFLLVFTLKTPILLLCGATPAFLSMSQTYLGITVFGMPFQLFTGASSHVIRADGSPAYSMTCTVTGVFLNVFLDWLFMYVFHWGIRGAAIATVIGQLVSFALCIRYYPRFRSFRITRELLRFRGEYAGRIARLGLSNCLNQIVMMLVNITLNNSLKFYGALSIYGSEIPLAVSGVVAKLSSILTSFAVGLALGCHPIWGYNMGAKNYSRVKEAYKKALGISLILCLITFGLFQLFPRQITSIFGSGEPLYYEFAERYLRTYMFMVCIFSVQPMSVNYFTGTGEVKQGILLSILRQGLVLIPLLLILPRFFGIDGVLYAGPIADFCAAAISLILVTRNFRALDKRKETETE